MCEIYRVTGASIGVTKRGYKIYKLQLNGLILATKLFPTRKNKQRQCTLFNKYKENNESLNFLVGRYVCMDITNTQYGYEFSSIRSFDPLEKFKCLLDDSKGKGFSTYMDVYEFLNKRNYVKNTDGAIMLKPPYNNFCLAQNNICYPINLKDSQLNLDNIKTIFINFYKGKEIKNDNLDRHQCYVLTPTAIIIKTEVFHKKKSKTINTLYSDVLRIGDQLTNEQYEFIISRKNEHNNAMSHSIDVVSF